MHQRGRSGVSEAAFLLVAVLVVGAICLPLWQYGSAGGESMLFTPQRLGRMLLGWEQSACYVCFVWAGLILLQHYWQSGNQLRALHLSWLPDDPTLRILPEDAPQLQRRVEQLDERGRYLLGRLLRMALEKFAVSRSAQQAAELVRAQAGIEAERQAVALSTVHYLAWAIPALGFVGTVRGISMALVGAPSLASDPSQVEQGLRDFLTHTSYSLAIAFDTTFVALLLSLVLLFLLHAVQRRYDDLTLQCQEYVLHRLIARLYRLELVTEEPSADGEALEEPLKPGRIPKG